MVQGCSSLKDVQLDQQPWDIDFLCFRLQTTLVTSRSTGKTEVRCGQSPGATENPKRANNQDLSKLKAKPCEEEHFHSWRFGAGFFGMVILRGRI